MASRKWVTDRTIDMLPVGVEDNSPYGWDLFNIYEKHFEMCEQILKGIPNYNLEKPPTPMPAIPKGWNMPTA